MAIRKTKYRAPDCMPAASIEAARLTPEELSRGTGPRPDKRKPWARDAASGASASSAAEAPPQVTRGERAATLVLRDGDVVEVPARRGYGGSSAFIDWINVTVDEQSFYWDKVPVLDDQLIVEVSVLCESIFGFGITSKREKGANFYRMSWTLGEGFGLVCYGGQRDTVLISLSGEGCAAARPGWEKRLYEFLEGRAVRPRITRIDLAHDDFTGRQYSVDRAVEDYDAGMFLCGGRMPDIETRGNWKAPNGKGRTVYVGNRINGKFLRVYEKGKQLGAVDSPWVRVEGELKAVDRHIPHDVLIEAGAYLAEMYPALGWISTKRRRIETVKREAQYSYKKMLEWLKRQCGAALWFAAEMEGGAAELIEKIAREELPRGLRNLSNWQTAGIPIHKAERVPFAPGRYVLYA